MDQRKYLERDKSNLLLFASKLYMRYSILLIYLVVLFSSCEQRVTKKFMLISNPGTVVDLEAKTITVTQTTAYEFKEFAIKDEGTVRFSVSTPNGNYTLELPKNGYYLINTKTTDTVVGSYQDYVAPKQDYTLLSQETLKQKTDSLINLMVGKNISEVNQNFFIPSKTASFITENLDAIFVAPYHSMTSLEVKKGTVPEVYRFYTNTDVRSMVEKMQELAKPIKVRK